MGCDINLYIEHKVKGKWVPFTDIPCSEYPNDRNYSVFALLAGVRGKPKKIYFPNRGIPPDCSYIENKAAHIDTNFCWLGEHSFTHATIHEFKKVDWEKFLEYEPSFSLFIKKYFPLPSARDKRIRIVMGFDS